MAIIVFPTILTLGGFYLFKEFEHQRMVESSKIKLGQLEHFNSFFLLDKQDSLKEKALRIASDNQIIVPFKLKVQYQLQDYLNRLFLQEEFVTLSLLSTEEDFK